MKILPGDDLPHKADYKSNFRKYFKEEEIDSLNSLTNKGLLSALLRIFFWKNSVRIEYFWGGKSKIKYIILSFFWIYFKLKSHKKW